jgi:HlyD family secretion protein
MATKDAKKPNTSSLLPRRLFSSKRRLAVIAVLVIAGVFIYSRLTAKPSGTESFQVKRKTLTTGLTANGKVEATSFADLKFFSPGEVSWVGVKKGDRVYEGQAVAKLNTVMLNANYQQALNSLRDAQANVESVLDSLQGHEKDETFAQRAERTTAEVARDNAYEQVIYARKALSNATVVSPLNGIVVDTNDIVTGLIISGADIETKYIKIVDPDTLYFAADVDEIDYKNISLGQQVNIVYDAYPDKVCHGEVGEIGGESQEEVGGVVTVPVKVRFEFCFLDLVTGFNGQANFIEEKVINVLAIPKKYIVDKDGEKYVWLQKGNSEDDIELVPVETGIETASDTEITKGLNAGETIVFVPTT